MYSYDVDAGALQKANNALSIIEQLDVICSQLHDLEGIVSLSNKADVAAISARADALLKVLNESEDDVLCITEETAKITQIGHSKIEKLGIGAEIIRLRGEAKMSYKDIATRFQLSASTVKNFCELYDKSKPLEQAKVRSTTPLDYERTWEDLGAMIYRMLARLENDPENHVKYISELRQLSVVVEKFQNKQTAQQKIEQIIHINKEILLDVLPEKAHLIMQRFNEVGLGRALAPTGLKLK
jgi:hypothetical protein